jgi:hypothetical protein
MAGGMLTKQADFLTAKYFNDVNDASSGGVIVSLPSGVTGPTVSQTLPGDRIVLDDATASALSDTTVGTLYGGIYMYTATLSSAAASPARGTCAFYRAADLPSAVANLYQVSSDAQTSTTVPSMIAGVFINAITKGNFGWIQIAGVASCLFDSTIAAAAVGGYVTTRGANGTAATVASTFDCGAAVVTPGSVTIANSQISCGFGVAIVLPVVSTITTVLITRSPFSRI